MISEGFVEFPNLLQLLLKAYVMMKSDPHIKLEKYKENFTYVLFLLTIFLTSGQWLWITFLGGLHEKRSHSETP